MLLGDGISTKQSCWGSKCRLLLRKIGWGWLTDLATAGVSLIVCVWKLKGFRGPEGGGGGPMLPMLIMLSTLNAEVALAGESIV